MPRFDDDKGPPYQGMATVAERPSRQRERATATLPDLPVEVSLSEAARILNCDKKQVWKLIKYGQLAVRNKSGPWSTRPQYAIELESVLKLRCSYRTVGQQLRRPPAATQRKSLPRPDGGTGYIRLD